MKKIIITFLIIGVVLLTGCSKLHIYQPDIQQGNLISDAKTDQLRIGMSKDEVVRIMGNPVLENLITENHWAYVYTMQRRGGPITMKRVDVYFQGGRVSSIERF